MRTIRMAEEEMQPAQINTENYHGIIVDASLKDVKIVSKLNVLSTKKDEEWTLYKVEVKAEYIEHTIARIWTELKPKFYAHFYRGEELIVAFADAVFRTTTNQKDWTAMIEYGQRHNIPIAQLDFKPCRTSDETW